MTQPQPSGRLKHPGVRFPPPTLFVAAFLAGWLLHREWPVPVVPDGRSPAVVGLGWFVVALGIAIMGWGLLTFVRHHTAIIPHRPASRLVDTGPYRYSRNPMYLGMATAYLGGVLVTNMFWPLLLLPLALLGLTRAVIRREERYLADAFGSGVRRVSIADATLAVSAPGGCSRLSGRARRR